METPRQRFIAALNHQPLTGRVPHMELCFFLTMEAFSKLHPRHRFYEQWDQMEEKERQMHRNDIADVYIATAERFEYSAIFLHPNPVSTDEILRLVDLVREKTGNRYFLMVDGEATFGIPMGNEMTEFSYRLADDPEGLKRDARERVKRKLEEGAYFQKHGGIDGIMLCADYCLNTGPFFSPSQFGEFVAPYLAELIQGYRDMGFYTLKHTDGNIMPILDQLAQCRPHALHSLDPQAGVDIAEIKRRYGQQFCLIGNVNCGLMDTGTDEEIRTSARYALRHGMPGGGYVFSTSNCIYTGMKLSRYEIMLDVWRQEGNYL